MLTHYVGPGLNALPDTEIDLPDDVARRYIATRQAEPVDPPAATIVEAATVQHDRQTATKYKQPQLTRRG